jgi:hypothetical protein
VSSLRSQDITIDEFSIETADPGHQFGTLLSIGLGHEISFSRADLPFVRSVCSELQNRELFVKTLTTEEGEIADDARLDFLSGLDGSCDWEASIVASHFHQFSVTDFDRVSLSVLEAILSDSRLVLADEDSLFEIVHRRASEDLSYFGLLEFVRFEFLSDDCMKRAFEFISDSLELLTFGIWSSLQTRLTLSAPPPLPPGRFCLPDIDSKIISATPTIFSGFHGKRFQLFYRGSRDGFEAKDFHDRCDGHRNTVTLISSTERWIFGGYTPLAWSSREGSVSDPSLNSFIFTIRNPHNLPPHIFKLKQEENAIYNHKLYGPRFGEGRTADLYVCGQCCSCHDSYSVLGRAYINDTGIAENQVLTGSQGFTVYEIEIFEVI